MTTQESDRLDLFRRNGTRAESNGRTNGHDPADLPPIDPPDDERHDGDDRDDDGDGARNVHLDRQRKWAEHEAAIRAAGHEPAEVEAAYWRLYGLLDRLVPNTETHVLAFTSGRASAGTSKARVSDMSVLFASQHSLNPTQTDVGAALADTLDCLGCGYLAAAQAIREGDSSPLPTFSERLMIVKGVTAAGNDDIGQSVRDILNGYNALRAVRDRVRAYDEEHLPSRWQRAKRWMGISKTEAAKPST